MANKQKRGFTIIELTVVVVVLIILLTISAAGVRVYLADARNDQRASKMMILSEALERYYDAKGEYPSCTAMLASPSSISTMLDDIDIDTLRPPTKENPESVTCNSSNFPSADNDIFMYESPYDNPPAPGVARSKFELMWWDESKKEVAGIFSRRGN